MNCFYKRGMQLKVSKYAFLILHGNEYIIYSSATGAIIKVNDKNYIERINEIKKEEKNAISTLCFDPEDHFITFLSENGIFVPVERDEFALQKCIFENSLSQNNILNLTVLTTRQCNLRCVYCYEEHIDKFMTADVYASIEKMIEQALRDRKYSGVQISLFGGEPFYKFDDVYIFLCNLKNICEKYNCTFGAGASTNGVLLTPERFDKLVDIGCNNFQITIDGLKDTHDMLRINRNGNGSWDPIIKNLIYAKSTTKDFQITIRTNFDTEVLSNADLYYQYIKKEFDDKRFSVYFENIKHLGGENDDSIEVNEGMEIIIADIYIAEILKKYNLQCSVTNDRTLPFGRMCNAIKHNSWVIDCDGTLHKCTLALDDEINNVGYINSDGELSVNVDNLIHWMMPSFDTPQCIECKLLPLCYGRSCVNGRAHGEELFCAHEQLEMEIEEYIKCISSK